MGKTTLAAFIKAMLYGFNDTKKTNLEENDRKHYLPWSGGLCGGSLTFAVGGKVYRVERSFAPKAADDTCTIYDTSNGRVCEDVPDGLGEGLFGIDADGFERTVFLSERALTPKSTNKSISAKLSDLVGCDGDVGELYFPKDGYASLRLPHSGSALSVKKELCVSALKRAENSKNIILRLYNPTSTDISSPINSNGLSVSRTNLYETITLPYDETVGKKKIATLVLDLK